jgi:hypothetical protein
MSAKVAGGIPAPQLLVSFAIPDFLQRLHIRVSERPSGVAIAHPEAARHDFARQIDNHLLPWISANGALRVHSCCRVLHTMTERFFTIQPDGQQFRQIHNQV